MCSWGSWRVLPVRPRSAQELIGAALNLPRRAWASGSPRASRCSRWPASAPVRVAQLGGDLQPQLVVVQRDRLKRPRRAGVQAEREVPPVGRDGDDVDLHADLGAAAEEAAAQLGELEAQLRRA